MSIIPEDIIAKIRNTADIIDVISDSVLLKKAGKNFLGLCPFHSEKTPSFSVSPDKQMFYCFGCGSGGNIFSFLMKQNGISFPESVRMLGRKYGVDVDIEEMTPEQKNAINERERILKLNKSAFEFYKNQFNDESSNYLLKRGFTKETIDKFSIGFARDGWENLVKHIKGKNIKKSTVLKSGLVLQGKKGGFYDRFRNRIIFPIFDLSNQVIGFGGRVMDDSLPKYLNSPETPVYYKSKSLYGLNSARQSIRENNCVYIVEGYFDMIALAQFGIENVVATLGTSLTSDHVEILKGFATKMVLVYDSDEAGLKAAIRSLEIFMKKDVDASVVVLPEGQDPDSYIFKNGKEKFNLLSSNSLKLIPFLIEISIKKHGLDIDGKIRVISDMIKTFSLMDDKMARSLYIKTLAERIGVDETAILEKTKEYTKKFQGEKRKENLQNSYKINSTREISKIEKTIVSMMIQFPEILDEVENREILNYFDKGPLKTLGLHILKQKDKNSDLYSSLDDKDARDLIPSLSMEENDWNLDGCIKVFEQFLSIKKTERNELIMQIKAAEEANNTELLLELLNKRKIQADKNLN
ncbi:MAG: DNA primase [Desulfobacterales bacterium]|nr:DNA primase [Desulfobacterales bacterium]